MGKKLSRSEIMSRIRSKRTKPEMRLHGFLKGNRIRHKMWPDMHGHPDVLIKDHKIVIFVNGCFWHGCRRHFKCPKTNSEFWSRKIKRNRVRQRQVMRHYKREGFCALVIWEHDLK